MIIRKLNKTQECTCTANLMKLGIGKSSPVILPPNPYSSPHCIFVIFVLFFFCSELSQVVHITDSG